MTWHLVGEVGRGLLSLGGGIIAGVATVAGFRALREYVLRPAWENLKERWEMYRA